MTKAKETRIAKRSAAMPSARHHALGYANGEVGHEVEVEPSAPKNRQERRALIAAARRKAKPL